LNKSQEILEKMKDNLLYKLFTKTYVEKHCLLIFTYFLHIQTQMAFAALEICNFGQFLGKKIDIN